jgi:prenyltransferase beta subunit
MRHSPSVIIGILLLLSAGPAAAAPPPRQDAKMDDATRQATAKALQWLASRQNANGSWGEGAYQHSTAITSFALLAFMSQGHLPGQGLYGPEVAKGARFLMGAARGDGYLVGARGGRMYDHGMATLALAELWGNTADEEIRPILEKAVKLTVRCQSAEGGWRYDPNPYGADISVTIMQVMALRAAKNAGLNVPDQTLKKAIHYINRCYLPNVGSFTYQPNSGAPGFARTAAGLCVLFLSGEYKAHQIPRAVQYLEAHFGGRPHYWYGHYYAAHAMHQVGGEKWVKWYDRLKRTMLPQQAPDGSFSRGPGDGVGITYQTAIAVIVLSVPMDYLPIFQR